MEVAELLLTLITFKTKSKEMNPKTEGKQSQIQRINSNTWNSRNKVGKSHREHTRNDRTDAQYAN